MIRRFVCFVVGHLPCEIADVAWRGGYGTEIVNFETFCCRCNEILMA
jgi:hypothetical protein